MINLLLYIVLVNGVQSTIEKNLTNHPSDDRYASYSPDGSQILFESNRSGDWDLYVMNTDGTMVRQITRDSSEDRRPSWHPNGDEILFESNRSGKFQLYTANLFNDKVKAIQIPVAKTEPIFAHYSPDGFSIAYSEKFQGDSSRLVIIDLLGKVKVELADYGFRSFYPRWSPDSKKILFFSRHETGNQDDEIYTINIDGTGKKRLTNWPKHNFCPSWSPNGMQIAYAQSMEGSRPEIHIMQADGSNAKRITFNDDGDTLPNWSPDGTKLLVTAYRNGNYEIVEMLIPSR
ncbi:MAG: hypothetical protein ABJF04_01035 [Reichenbachiella sp.]|uniref:TolB family protein n=1 Tax=Reichenbachiella sp. TaxID=2184521 RepID=UPI003262E161